MQKGSKDVASHGTNVWMERFSECMDVSEMD